MLYDRLIPLMCRDNNYRNVITRSDITLLESDLVEFIFSDRIIKWPDGTLSQLNQSFQNLIDAEILALKRQGVGRDDEISFKYERFYDYFISQYLEKQFKDLSPADKLNAYIDLASKLSEITYLWGPLYRTLVQECEGGSLVSDTKSGTGS